MLRISAFCFGSVKRQPLNLSHGIVELSFSLCLMYSKSRIVFASVWVGSFGDAGDSTMGLGNSQSTHGDVVTSTSIGDDTTKGIYERTRSSE